MTRQARCHEEPAMTDTPDAIRAAVEQRFAQVARSPDQETKFPVGPASSLVVALPPGWCSGFMRHEGAVPAPAKAACCHQTAKDQPSESKQPPAAPTVECCCQREATVPGKSVQPTEVSSLALPLV